MVLFFLKGNRPCSTVALFQSADCQSTSQHLSPSYIHTHILTLMAEAAMQGAIRGSVSCSKILWHAAGGSREYYVCKNAKHSLILQTVMWGFALLYFTVTWLYLDFRSLDGKELWSITVGFTILYISVQIINWEIEKTIIKFRENVIKFIIIKLLVEGCNIFHNLTFLSLTLPFLFFPKKPFVFKLLKVITILKHYTWDAGYRQKSVIQTVHISFLIRTASCNLLSVTHSTHVEPREYWGVTPASSAASAVHLIWSNKEQTNILDSLLSALV